MANFSSAGEFAREIAEFQRKLEREYAREIGKRVGKQAQDLAEREARKDLGGDPEFSGWPKARLDTKVKEIPTGAILMPDGKLAAGGWTVANFGRNSANGPAQLPSGRRQRVLKSGRLSTARGTRRRWNGQTRGKGTADRAISRMEKEFPPVAEREIVADLRKHFDVT